MGNSGNKLGVLTLIIALRHPLHLPIQYFGYLLSAPALIQLAPVKLVVVPFVQFFEYIMI